MSETKFEDSSPESSPRKAADECFLCGRKESGAWHYSATMGRFVCDECYKRAMSPPQPPPRPGR